MTSHEDHTGLARVVSDIHAKRVQPISSRENDQKFDIGFAESLARVPGPLIDSTFIYKTYEDRSWPVTPESFPSVKPPWDNAFIGFISEYGQPVVTVVEALPYSEKDDRMFRHTEGFKVDGGIDLDSASWVVWGVTFINVFPCGPKWITMGPVCLSHVIVSDEGAVLWHRTQSPPEGRGWGGCAMITVLATFSLLNSTNCSIVESPLSRPLRRTEQRYGVRSHVIQVTTSNRGRAGSRAGEPSTITYPLTSVRGHHAHYGDCCPRFHEPKGLLFGKLTGRVWVPQYARGDEAVGRVEQTFVMGDGE